MHHALSGPASPHHSSGVEANGASRSEAWRSRKIGNPLQPEGLPSRRLGTSEAGGVGWERRHTCGLSSERIEKVPRIAADRTVQPGAGE